MKKFIPNLVFAAALLLTCVVVSDANAQSGARGFAPAAPSVGSGTRFAAPVQSFSQPTFQSAPIQSVPAGGSQTRFVQPSSNFSSGVPTNVYRPAPVQQPIYQNYQPQVIQSAPVYNSAPIYNSVPFNSGGFSGGCGGY